MNLGAILRTAHAFGASFAFTIAAHHRIRDVALSDTSRSAGHVPLFNWATIDDASLPMGCVLVGVELDDAAATLPTFRHPHCAAYLFGPEKGSLSAAAQARCESLVKIPTRFCVNLSVAAAIVMYDRMLTLGGYPPRPLSSLPWRTAGGEPPPDSTETPLAALNNVP